MFILTSTPRKLRNYYLILKVILYKIGIPRNHVDKQGGFSTKTNVLEVWQG